MVDNSDKINVDDVICRSRIYKCLGCGFVGNEEKADKHQCTCDSPMELIS